MNITQLIKYFYNKFPHFVNEMKDCDHNINLSSPNSYHLEGSVLCHVMLILKQIEQAEYLIDYDKYIFSIIALCHDLGKKEARIIDNGKVTFYNHDGISAFKSIEVLNDLKLNQQEKELVFQVIAHHTQVFKLSRQQLFDKVKDIPLMIAIELFGYFDHNGRFHDNVAEAKGETFSQNYNVVPDTDKTVTIMVGLPASGKSTYVEQNAPEGSFIVSRDTIVEALGDGITYEERWNSVDQKEVDRVLQHVFSKAKRESNNVFIDMTHLSAKSRRRSLSIFGKEWKKNCVVMLPSLTKLEQNSTTRKNTTGKFVGNDVVLQMMKNFSCPSYGEGFHNINWRFV